MKILVNKAHYPVRVLGPGRRIGIWTQGCRIHCPGCVSRDTWDADPTRAIDVGVLVAWCRALEPRGVSGVTLTGGEPFDQPQALWELLQWLVAWRTERGLELDILCYSGYALTVLRQRHSLLLGALDAVIPEPFRVDLPLGGPLRGSSNQSIVPLTPRGHALYGQLAGELQPKAHLQVAVQAGQVWYIGIPGRGDMERLQAIAEAQGVSQEGVSWRT